MILLIGESHEDGAVRRAAPGLLYRAEIQTENIQENRLFSSLDLKLPIKRNIFRIINSLINYTNGNLLFKKNFVFRNRQKSFFFWSVVNFSGY